MNKLTKLSNKQLLMSGGILAVLILLMAATWGRGFIVSNVARVFYLKPVQQMIVKRDGELANPFHTFGMDTLEKTSSCHVTAATFISTQVECTSSAHGYVKLSDNKDETVQKARALEATLEKQGYKAGSNEVTFTSLVAGTYEGKDYSPDAFYQKIDGPYMCVFDTTIAYANPAPRAISMDLSCRRTLEILGTPSNAGYRSSQGYL